jgi:hypothetical protein
VETSVRPALERGRDDDPDDDNPHIHDMSQHKLRVGYELEQHRATAILLLADIQPYVPQVCACFQYLISTFKPRLNLART